MVARMTWPHAQVSICQKNIAGLMTDEFSHALNGHFTIFFSFYYLLLHSIQINTDTFFPCFK